MVAAWRARTTRERTCVDAPQGGHADHSPHPLVTHSSSATAHEGSLRSPQGDASERGPRQAAPPPDGMTAMARDLTCTPPHALLQSPNPPHWERTQSTGSSSDTLEGSRGGGGQAVDALHAMDSCFGGQAADGAVLMRTMRPWPHCVSQLPQGVACVYTLGAHSSSQGGATHAARSIRGGQGALGEVEDSTCLRLVRVPGPHEDEQSDQLVHSDTWHEAAVYGLQSVLAHGIACIHWSLEQAVPVPYA